VRVTDEFYFARPEIDGLVAKLKKFAENSANRLVDVAQFKDIAGISRKYAIPLLEYFDRERVTRRAGDKRLIL
jgi:selenocysteine-specific elongation factor